MKTEAWMVLVKRKDGALPDPVKMCFKPCEQGLYFVEDEAHSACQYLNGGMPYRHPKSYGVFRVEVEVMEELK